MSELFHKLSSRISSVAGSPTAFVVAIAIIIIWGVSGPIFSFSDTWQLIINTSTTIVTFLMVFLIQNTQNRDSKAIQIKLDELLRGVKGARTGLVDIEDVPDEELEKLYNEFKELHVHYSRELVKRGKIIKTSEKEQIDTVK
ncbi:MAG: low affinity iron permease family protein [Candidatus Daviesbacteria bacterium]|nr:low affinity iron permease family protein [Candidatus Daviesbacteria bacterium]